MNTAYASEQPGDINLIEVPDVAPVGQQVSVKVTHCGVGRGDVDFIDRKFSNAELVVAGHEVVGVVAAVGPDVSLLNPGQRVGVGYQVSSCGSCQQCQTGSQQFCRAQRCLIVDTFGGFAEHILADEQFVFPLPDTLESSLAASLLSSGLTAYSAVKNVHTLANNNVAVVGIGGMGHIATQLLRRGDARVTAVTSRIQSTREWNEIGVDRAITMSDLLTFDDQPFDEIYVTSSAVTTLDPFLCTLTPRGTLIFLASPTEPLTFSTLSLNDFSSRSITGSYIGNPAELNELLALATDGKVIPHIESRPFSDVAEVLEQVRSNSSSPHRIVLSRCL